jgi:hypothetical protein
MTGLYAIELAPPQSASGSWRARVTVAGRVTERDGFALPYTAYHWCLDTYAQMETES